MTANDSLELLHATAVAINGEGVMLIGPSGSGKSDLALRLIDRGAVLISDDAVLVNTNGMHPILQTAPNIAGLIEMRGVGMVKMPFVDGVRLHLAVKMGLDGERLPLEAQTMDIAGFKVDFVTVSAFEASAPLKIEQALRL